MRAPSSRQVESTRLFPHSMFALSPTSDQVRVLTVSTQSLARARLRLIIESHPKLMVVGEAGDYFEAIDIAFRERPHFMLLDMDLREGNGISYVNELASAARDARVLVLTDVHSDKSRRKAFGGAPCDFASLENVTEVLLKGIDQEADKIAALTARERSIIALVANGLNDKRISGHLGLSDTTFRGCFESVLKKLEVEDRFELLIYSFVNGLASPPSKAAKMTSKAGSAV